MSPMREPIKLPKITKYKLIVIAGGTKVCTQIRKKRIHSLIHKLFKATPYLNIYSPRPCSSNPTNNSSSLFALFRILNTVLPWFVNALNTAF